MFNLTQGFFFSLLKRFREWEKNFFFFKTSKNGRERERERDCSLRKTTLPRRATPQKLQKLLFNSLFLFFSLSLSLLPTLYKRIKTHTHIHIKRERERKKERERLYMRKLRGGGEIQISFVFSIYLKSLEPKKRGLYEIFQIFCSLSFSFSLSLPLSPSLSLSLPLSLSLSTQGTLKDSSVLLSCLLDIIITYLWLFEYVNVCTSEETKSFRSLNFVFHRRKNKCCNKKVMKALKVQNWDCYFWEWK